MKLAELIQKPSQELKTMLSDYRDKLRQLRFDLARGKVKNVREVRHIKKDIARILTLLRNAK